MKRSLTKFQQDKNRHKKSKAAEQTPKGPPKSENKANFLVRGHTRRLTYRKWQTDDGNEHKIPIATEEDAAEHGIPNTYDRTLWNPIHWLEPIVIQESVLDLPTLGDWIRLWMRRIPPLWTTGKSVKLAAAADELLKSLVRLSFKANRAQQFLEKYLPEYEDKDELLTDEEQDMWRLLDLVDRRIEDAEKERDQLEKIIRDCETSANQVVRLESVQPKVELEVMLAWMLFSEDQWWLTMKGVIMSIDLWIERWDCDYNARVEACLPEKQEGLGYVKGLGITL